MKKLALIMLPLIVAACASTVEVEDKAKYKCGNDIITTTFFSDDSMMMVFKGKESVLSRDDAAKVDKYVNLTDKLVFWDKGNEVYLESNDQGYPACKKIID